MGLTAREQNIWDNLLSWEEGISKYESNDLSMIYDKVVEGTFERLPNQIKEICLQKLDNWMFHLHAIIQSSQFQIDAREKILADARIFNEDITTVEDLKSLSIDQLNYLANQQIARHRLYSFTQGGTSGFGGILLGGDIPAVTVINMRIVQLIATVYGYEVKTPVEMMLALKVFHAGMMPKRLQGTAWEEMIQDMKTMEDDYFYLGNEELTNMRWIEQPMKQIVKLIAISSFRKKQFQGIPFISMAIGAGANYRMTHHVSDFAQKFYQYRYLHDKHFEK